MNTYRPDQGRMARMFAFWTLMGLMLFGSAFLYRTLFNLVEGLRPALGGIHIPVVNVAVNGAFLIAAVVFAIGAFLIARWQAKTNVADFLIETESELKKVHWPSWTEVLHSSLVVVGCVIFLMGFLAVVDAVYGRLFDRIFLS